MNGLAKRENLQNAVKYLFLNYTGYTQHFANSIHKWLGKTCESAICIYMRQLRDTKDISISELIGVSIAFCKFSTHKWLGKAHESAKGMYRSQLRDIESNYISEQIVGIHNILQIHH